MQTRIEIGSLCDAVLEQLAQRARQQQRQRKNQSTNDKGQYRAFDFAERVFIVKVVPNPRENSLPAFGKHRSGSEEKRSGRSKLKHRSSNHSQHLKAKTTKSRRKPFGGTRSAQS